MTSPANTFTTSPLISASDLVENAAKALQHVPAEYLSMGTAPLQTALLMELNRFPGKTTYSKVPHGFEREAVLAEVEERAKQWEAVTGKPLALSAPMTVQLYLQNLRQLFLCVDLEATEMLRNGATQEVLDHDDILNSLTNPEAAIAFALDHLEAFEVAEFLSERREGKSLLPWIETWQARRKVANGDWSGFDRLDAAE